MNLLVVSSWLPYPLDNGSRVRAYHLLRHLSRRHQITLLTFGLPGGQENAAPLQDFCKTVAIVPPTPINPDRLGWRGLVSHVPRHLVQNQSPVMTALVSRHMAGQRAAVGLQVDAARYLRGWPAIPKIFEEVEVAVLRDRYLNESQAFRRARHATTWWKFRRYIRHLVQGFERATVVSEPEREHLRTIGCDPARVSVVPNGVEIDVEPKRDAGTRTTRLIYPGAVTYSANLDAVRFFITDIFPLLRRTRPDVEFWVTGSTHGIDLSHLAGPGVRFTGCLPEVDSVITDSAACVVPLRIGGGTRLKVLQAMALSTPVVSTSKGIEGLDISPERHVLVADSPDAFAAQVLRLLSDQRLADRLTREARQLVRERYAWPEIGNALERVIEEAVETHVGPNAR
jgi:glycosyltransferase involved in cell wall biosynthesis